MMSMSMRKILPMKYSRARNMRTKIRLAVLTCALFPMAGCGQTSKVEKLDGLTSVVYNYSDEAIASVRVDGELAGTGLEAIRPGDVSGGGRSCCMAMAPFRAKVPVTIEPAIGTVYTIQATVEQPWPKDPTTAIVHVLPGRKVVIETSLGVNTGPRKDLLDSQLKELGVEREVNIDWFMNPGRDTYSEYMEAPTQ